ncbi:HAD-IB family hydrolase [Klebsiella michiganensis]|nr:HAD-IB family hydrolase [Klebsiella michiganensis]HBU6430622.1 HAD-IB family hydrolase [Klebsiella oxytoca]
MLHKKVKKDVLAVFDFDGTLTDRHTFWRYVRFIRGPIFFWIGIFVMLPHILAVLLRITPLMQARRSFINYFLAGVNACQEEALAKKYVSEYLPKCIRQQALRRLRWHQSQGHTIALISNSPENYLEVWGRSINVNIICGTKLDCQGEFLTGKVTGEDCVGSEKVHRLRERLPSLENYHIYAYGDSSGDAELLAIADAAFYRNWY